MQKLILSLLLVGKLSFGSGALSTSTGAVPTDDGVSYNTSTNSLTITGSISTPTLSASTTVSSPTISASTQFKSADGSATSPGYTFTDEVGLGLYRKSANVVSLTGYNGSSYTSVLETTNTGQIIFPLADAGNLKKVYFGSVNGGNIFQDSSGPRFSAGNGQQLFIYSGASQIASFDASGGTIEDMRLEGSVSYAQNNIDLTSDNQSVTVQGVGLVKFTSDNATAANRTIVLGDGYNSNQMLTLIWNEDTATGAGELPDNTANNVRLSAIWTPGQFDTLTLMWDSVDSNWLEISRSDN